MRQRTLVRIGAAVGVMLLVGWAGFHWLERMRMSSGRVPCGSNLRQIGQACRQYAMDHDGPFPQDLDAVFAYMRSRYDNFNPDIFVCPDADLDPGPPPLILGRNASYVYLGGGKTDSAGWQAALGYCDSGAHDHDGSGSYVLAGDGSVSYVRGKAFEHVLSTGKLETDDPPPEAEG